MQFLPSLVLPAVLPSSLSGSWKKSWTATESQPDALTRLAVVCSVIRTDIKKP